MAKYPKAASATIEKLKAELKAAKAAAAAKLKATKAAASKKPEKKPKKAKKRQVYAHGSPIKTKKGEIPVWEGATPKKLTVYKVRLMLDEQQIGIFGPYATIRAASADAKNILRMHVGPNHQIEEIGTDEPVLRSDGRVKLYFHPTVYSGQATDKGVLTAQVIEQGGEAQRKKTFVKKYNPARGGTRKSALAADARAAGYAVETYSPGDGVTRYRFFSLAEMARRGVSQQEQTYFGPLNGVHTALGLAAAKKWLAKH
jgi:hypothetical protein